MTFEDENPFAVISRNQAAPPVNVVRIAEELGLRVAYMDLGKSVSAMIRREAGRTVGPFQIVVNSTEVSVRQRFSLAHEIAHFVLHRDLIDQGIVDDTMYRSAQLSSYHETQANQLAADILMPVRLVKKTFAATQSLFELANMFQVSKGAMQIRLKGMGYTQVRP